MKREVILIPKPVGNLQMNEILCLFTIKHGSCADVSVSVTQNTTTQICIIRYEDNIQMHKGLTEQKIILYKLSMTRNVK